MWKAKNTLMETVGEMIMLMGRWHGIYIEEHMFVRTNNRKGKMLIENRHWRTKRS